MMRQWTEILELNGDVGRTSLVTCIAKNLGLLENASIAYIDDIPHWYIDYEYFVQAHMLKKIRMGNVDTEFLSYVEDTRSKPEGSARWSRSAYLQRKGGRSCANLPSERS